jgi:hypothetical protein
MRSAPAQSWRVSGWDEVSVRTAVAVLRAIPIAAMLIASTSYASPGERDKLNACQALVERSAQTRQSGATATASPDDAEFARCRQIIKEWSLRDSRMNVDEQGRPLR